MAVYITRNTFYLLLLIKEIFLTNLKNGRITVFI